MDKQRKIPKSAQWLMVGTAMFFDTIQLLIGLIPIMGQIIGRLMTPIVFLTFYVWFKLYGMNFMKPKRLATIGFGSFFEILLSELPGWTITVLLLIKGQDIINVVDTVAPGAKNVGKIIK